MCCQGGGGDAFLPGQDEDWKSLIRSSYAIWGDSAGKAPNRLDFTGVLDNVEEELYIHWAGVHLNPRGNRIVAESLATALVELRPADTPDDSLP